MAEPAYSSSYLHSSYSSQSYSSQSYSSDTRTQFAGLVEAATIRTAAAEEEEEEEDKAGEIEGEGSRSRHESQPEKGDCVSGGIGAAGQPERRIQAPHTQIGIMPGQRSHSGLRRELHDSEEVVQPSATQPWSRKRRRLSYSTDEDDGGNEEQIAARPTALDSSPNRNYADVDSAAALFRTPSTMTKKRTRPPISKLFGSLQLLPEDFLRLQSAAKAYMLAEDHPERRDCVGQRGKTDSDMVKLKLWNCVQDFLDREGNGEVFFGVGAPKAHIRDGSCLMTWPDDAQRVVKTCVPLLRRIVTNERQRRYAVESRRNSADSRRVDHRLVEKREKEESQGAHVHEMDNAASQLAPRVDISCDGPILDGAECSDRYNIYNADGMLDDVWMRSGYPRGLFMPIVAGIDTHCRLSHGKSGSQCDDLCRSRLAKTLVEVPLLRQPTAQKRNLDDVVREVFDIILAHLVHARYWEPVAGGDQEPAGTRPIQPALKARDRDPHPSKESVSSNKTPSQLLIYLVRQHRCLLPCLELPSTQCPNIRTLRQQILEYHGLNRLQEKGVASLSEVTLKVWLSDGLVTVHDDGQWMVALLSADTVEWMGGQIRVILDL